jgi:S-adenosylmethionine hydrolase
MALITLTTDFGTVDGFVASMKGVILRLCPGAQIVDVTHEIPPHDVLRAAYVIDQAARWFPHNTIHVVVVDPGVGGDRRILLARLDDQIFVAPDNGVLTRVARRAKGRAFWSVTDRRYMLDPISHTFHGRDIFTPVAAYVADHTPLEKFGPRVQDILELPMPEPAVLAGPCIEGMVVYVDRFGNLMTNIEQDLLATTFGAGAAVCVQVADETVLGPLASYSEAAPGQLLSILNSAGLLELAIRDASAAVHLRADVGTRVLVEPARKEADV